MMTAQWLYALTGCLIIAIGLRSAVLHASMIKRIIAYRGQTSAPDPVPHALVLTGIVVAVSATALALALIRRLRGEQADD